MPRITAGTYAGSCFAWALACLFAALLMTTAAEFAHTRHRERRTNTGTHAPTIPLGTPEHPLLKGVPKAKGVEDYTGKLDRATIEKQVKEGRRPPKGAFKKGPPGSRGRGKFKKEL